MPGIAYRRKRAGLSQVAFAEALGVSRSAVAMWETERAYPSAQLLPFIAAVCGCTIDDLYTTPEAV